MLPLRAETLSLWDIAEHCARELGGRRSEVEICNELEQSWLRGDLQCTRPELRLSFLRALHRAQDGRHYFFVSGDDPEPNRVAGFEDGSCQVDLRLAIPIPSRDPDHWTLENCVKAFDILGSDWKEELAPDIVLPTLGAVVITRKNFIDYTKARGYDEISFWAASRSDMPPQAFAASDQGASSFLPRIEMPEKAALAHFEKNMWPEELDPLPDDQWFSDRIKELGYVNCRETARDIRTEFKERLGLPNRPGRFSTAERRAGIERAAALRRNI